PIFDSWGLSIATREPLIGGNLQDYILKDNERIDQAPGTVNDYFNQLMGIFKSSADTRPCPTLEQEVQFDFDRDGCGYTPLPLSSTEKEMLRHKLPKNIHELGTTIIS